MLSWPRDGNPAVLFSMRPIAMAAVRGTRLALLGFGLPLVPGAPVV